MKRLLSPFVLVTLLWCAAHAMGMQASIALSRDYHGEGSEFIISWEATPGESYKVEAATDLTGTWRQLNATPIVAQSDVETYRDRTTSLRKFYRVWRLEAEPPRVAYLNPGQGAIAVGRQEMLIVRLEDESGIDRDSLSLSIGSSSAVGVDDPRLTYSEGILCYTPAEKEYYGDYGETVTASLSVSDRLGNRLEDYSWSFKLELETILADNVLLIHENSPLTLLSVDGDTYIFSYTGASPGISVGDILVSTDPDNAYRRRSLNVTDHPESQTVELLTTTALLAEILERGSIRVRHIAPEKTPGSSPLGHVIPAPFVRIHYSLPLDGLTIYEGKHITVEVTSGLIELILDSTLAADFEGLWMQSFDLEVAGTVNFDATLRATASATIDYAYKKNLKTFRRYFVQFIGQVPVIEEVILEFNIGFIAEADVAGWIEAGFKSSDTLTLAATVRDGTCSTYSSYSTDSSPVLPTWQINGGIDVTGYVEAKLTVLLYGVAGASINLWPYLRIDGWFQDYPPAYDWTLSAGLISDLALELGLSLGEIWKLPSWRLIDWEKQVIHTEYWGPGKSGTTLGGIAMGDPQYLRQTLDGATRKRNGSGLAHRQAIFWTAPPDSIWSQ